MSKSIFTNEKDETNCLSILINFAKRFDNQDITEDEVKQYFVDNYYFNNSTEIDVQIYRFINNFITLVSDVFKDLHTINDNIKQSNEVLKIEKGNDSNSYEEKKHRYFLKINKEAKEEKEKYLLNDLIPKLKDKMKYRKNGLDDISNLEKFDYYSWHSDWYNPNFDFGVLVKFFDPLKNNLSEVFSLIDLKKSDENEYYTYVKNHIRKNKVLEYILLNVRSHYLLCEKQEVFSILYGLFESEKYQTFVSLGAIQVEGLFYDFCSALNGGERKDEEGTLINKLEKVFADYKIQELMYYPYFAFEVPKFRNQVAHNGVATNYNMEYLALNIIMDMYTIIRLMKRHSLPFNNVEYLIFQMKFHSNIYNYSSDNYEKILFELFSTFQMNIDGNGKYSIYNIIKERETHKKILEKYKIYMDEECCYSIYEETSQLIKVFEDEDFWGIILEFINRNGIEGNGFMDFIKKLVKEFIPYLKNGSRAKDKCIEINRLISRSSNK